MEGDDGKVCTKCGEWKMLEEYHTAKRKDGSRKPVAACKVCTNAANREYARKNSAVAVERVRRWRKAPENRERKNELERSRRKNPETAKKNNEYNKEWRSRPENRDRLNAAKREKRMKDPEYRAKDLAYKEEYYRRPDVRERVLEKSRLEKSTRDWKDKFNARRRERYIDDPDFLCTVKIRGMLIRTCKKAKIRKEGRTADILGYTANQFRLRIECQFKAGMDWSNHGEWHVDHKKPIAAFLAQGITNPRIINALCNLQPMWREENQAKGAQWPVAANDNNQISIKDVA
ncbi:hypothetical protein [Shinella sp.]|uniref:hypothetical protein n=1 Tax=Shinella sp. TaxID=1870904 RepID=UPI0028A94B34|nr:hypothetical protein [Shinella sp.]